MFRKPFAPVFITITFLILLGALSFVDSVSAQVCYDQSQNIIPCEKEKKNTKKPIPPTRTLTPSPTITNTPTATVTNTPVPTATFNFTPTPTPAGPLSALQDSRYLSCYLVRTSTPIAIGLIALGVASTVISKGISRREQMQAQHRARIAREIEEDLLRNGDLGARHRAKIAREREIAEQLEEQRDARHRAKIAREREIAEQLEEQRQARHRAKIARERFNMFLSGMGAGGLAGASLVGFFDICNYAPIFILAGGLTGAIIGSGFARFRNIYSIEPGTWKEVGKIRKELSILRGEQGAQGSMGNQGAQGTGTPAGPHGSSVPQPEPRGYRGETPGDSGNPGEWEGEPLEVRDGGTGEGEEMEKKLQSIMDRMRKNDSQAANALKKFQEVINQILGNSK